MKVKAKVFGTEDINGEIIPKENLKKMYKQLEGKPVNVEFDPKRIIGKVIKAEFNEETGDVVIESQLDEEALKKLGIDINNVDCYSLAGSGVATMKEGNVRVLTELKPVGFVAHSLYKDSEIEVLKKKS